MQEDLNENLSIENHYKEHTPLLLSICVPTYNRPKDFERMLRGVLPQLTSETELIIRDDSISLESEEIFKKFADFKINYRYFKGKKIGFDRASLFLLNKARGKYMWWFSDDDEMAPGSIDRVLKLVKENPDIDFIWANFIATDTGVLAVSQPDKFFKNGDEVLDDIGTNIGLMSTLILKKEAAQPFLGLAQKYVGSAFANITVVFGIISGFGKFYFLRGPYVICHLIGGEELKVAVLTGERTMSQMTDEKNTIKNDGFQVYGINFYNIIHEFDGKFSREAVRRILKTNFAALWRGMLVGCVGGWDTLKGKRWKMFKLYWNFPEFWIAMPLFLMPLWINKILYKIYKIFFSHRKWVFGENLRRIFKK
ncbi:MAG: glycosyltransferase [Patescibacteria group bacterium]|nr:glycosyltransferase [Patescibacteria group bacterium]